MVLTLDKCSRDCPKRHIGCQQSCEVHARFLEQQKIIKDNRKRFIDLYHATGKQYYISGAKMRRK